MKKKMQYDAIVVGGSYSGLAAAMALGRALRKVLVVDSGLPCNRQTPHSHNFLTQDGKPPKMISTIAKQQVSMYKTVDFFEGIVISAKKVDGGFEVRTTNDDAFTAKKVVFATGIKDLMPNIIGFSACWGISALHCPYCHGYEVRNEKTGIIGNGEYGFDFSRLIHNWTKDLTLYTNGKSTLSKEQTTLLKNHNIRIEEKVITELKHSNGAVEAIFFVDGTSEKLNAVYAKLPFEQHCMVPQQLGCAVSEEGYLVIDSMNRTTISGIFACGDNASRMRTVANAIAMGTTTGIMVNKELVEQEFAT